jgi:hypothetical protein
MPSYCYRTNRPRKPGGFRTFCQDQGRFQRVSTTALGVFVRLSVMREKFTQKTLCNETRLGLNSLEKCIRELKQADLLYIANVGYGKFIYFLAVDDYGARWNARIAGYLDNEVPYED